VEPSYKTALTGFIPGEIGVFFRYSEWDERGTGGPMADHEMINVGANWWPTENVVFKIDGQWEKASANTRGTQDGFNLGLGFQF